MGSNQVASFLVVLALISLLVVSVSAIPSWETMDAIKEVNSEGPYLGIITVYPPEDEAFHVTADFKPHSKHPIVDMAGRRFRVGTINNTKVIYVRCGIGLVNAAAATQQMLDFFDITGIVHFGVAGSLNSSMNFGDVTILKQVANTAIWDWLNPDGTTDHDHVTPHDLNFGNYSIPPGDVSSNALGRVGYRPERFLSESGVPNKDEEVTWFKSDEHWFQLASTLEGRVDLDQCYNSTCLEKEPKLVAGLNGSAANIFMDNEAYGKFLVDNFNVSCHDMESSAVAMITLSNGYPVIVFRGLSDSGGREIGPSLIKKYREIAAHNTVKVVVQFINILSETDRKLKYEHNMLVNEGVLWLMLSRWLQY